MRIFSLTDRLSFPPPHLADRNGLLAVGGDLRPERLILAYENGIFPWYNPDEPILWWSPNPRLVLFPGEIHISKSLRKLLKKQAFDVTLDSAFPEVIHACANSPRRGRYGTWLGPEMIAAYTDLHHAGFAHSVDVWENGALVGGLYGVSLGGCFFGESMFSHVSNASKVAFATLALLLHANDFDMIDCQVTTRHLMQFGAREIPRKEFLARLKRSLGKPARSGRWVYGDAPEEPS